MNSEKATTNQYEGYWVPKVNTETKIVMVLIALFLGTLGIHRFFSKKILTGILYLFTFGFLGFGVIIDLILIAIGNWDFGDFRIGSPRPQNEH